MNGSTRRAEITLGAVLGIWLVTGAQTGFACDADELAALRASGYSPELIQEHCYEPAPIPPVPGERWQGTSSAPKVSDDTRAVPPTGATSTTLETSKASDASSFAHACWNHVLRETTEVTDPRTGEVSTQMGRHTHWYIHHASGVIVGNEDPYYDGTGEWVRLDAKC